MKETKIQLSTCTLVLPAGFSPAQFTFDLYLLGKRMAQPKTTNDNRKVRPKKAEKLT